MKQDLIKDVIQGMLPYLNNAQSEKLQEVLQYTLVSYEVTENQQQEKNSERNFVELFLSAKRIEGCSEKSLKYYRATIEAMLDELNKNVKHIVTDDIREYLTEYQEAAFFESVRVLVGRLMNAGTGKKISLPEINARINQLLKQSIKSDGVINLFSDVKEEFSLFDPKFLEEISKMKEKNLAVELLKKLIAEQVHIYKRTNVVKSEKFSELIHEAMNRYLNGMLTNEQVIEELLNLAKQIAAAQKEGEQLGLTADELAFYDALTKPQAIKDFYENEELIAITKELAETLRKNKTIDWQKRESARAKMRMLIKKLLKKHKYPPEGMEDAVQTVMTQCELWTDNNDMEEEKVIKFRDKSISYTESNYSSKMVAEGAATYGAKK